VAFAYLLLRGRGCPLAHSTRSLLFYLAPAPRQKLVVGRGAWASLVCDPSSTCTLTVVGLLATPVFSPRLTFTLGTARARAHGDNQRSTPLPSIIASACMPNFFPRVKTSRE
jgi:hypothetical protein